VVPQLDLMTEPAAPVRQTPAAAPRGRAPSARAVLAAVIIVVALSAAVRFVNLGVYRTYVFDEHYYAHDAGVIVHGDLGPREPAPWKPGAARSLAHPELGTLAIAAGVEALGNGPWGWRVPSAIAGTLLIALVYPLARRLGLTPRWALVALVLAAADTMLMTESRIGVLDPFVALWSAVCIYCALRFVQSGRPARWLVLTGLAGGLAVASKWSGLLALACLVALPLAVYLASYADYFASGHTLGQWLHLQRYMATFNWNVRGTSGMASRPLTWIFDATPIWYRWALGPHGDVVGLIAIGNPFLFWGSIVAFIAVVWLAVRQRELAGTAPALLLACLYLPWLATSRESYIYYLTPAIPFLAILVAGALARLVADRPLPRGRAALCGVAGAVFVGLAAGGGTPLRLAALATLVAVVAAATLVGRERAAARTRLPALAAWVYVGAVVGLAVAWLPFIVSQAAPYTYYARLAWLTSWR
jgi:dolichyl-phosphate-mannose--protein O-mannosyl transferase